MKQPRKVMTEYPCLRCGSTLYSKYARKTHVCPARAEAGQ